MITQPWNMEFDYSYQETSNRRVAGNRHTIVAYTKTTFISWHLFVSVSSLLSLAHAKRLIRTVRWILRPCPNFWKMRVQRRQVKARHLFSINTNLKSPTMPLVDYSSSDAEDDEVFKSAHSLKRKRPSPIQETTSLPPLPPAFHNLYSTNTRTSTSDNPALHGGRTRQIPHVQGNWPSHVYLECEFSQYPKRMSEIHLRAWVDPLLTCLSFQGTQLLQKQAFSIL